MLRPGLLGTLADWVLETYVTNEHAQMEADREFGLQELISGGADPDGVFMLFTEWLVFDRPAALFAGHTGLSHFLKHNPLDLPKTELAAYRDLACFSCGMFEVVGVEQGSGVTLRSCGAEDTEHFVNDVNTSLSAAPETILWGRIAEVSGVWHFVGSTGLTLAASFGPQLRKEMRTWDQKGLDARWAAHWRYGSRESAEPAEPADTTLPYQEAKANFAAALERCDMQEMFTISRFEAWVQNERKYDRDLALKALIFLTPERVDDTDSRALVKAGEQFMNTIIRGAKRTQSVVERTTADASAKELGIECYAVDRYAPYLQRAHAYMADGAFEAALETFEEVIEQLLADRTPFVSAFRIYANAGVVSFEAGDPGLGAALLDASLRLNPRYVFARRQQERYQSVYEKTDCENFSESNVPTQLSSVAENVDDDLPTNMMWPAMRYLGEMDYKRSVFKKYESFLKHLGISLSCGANVVPTVFSGGKEVAPGRNEPCPCGSGKKFKKCCG